MNEQALKDRLQKLETVISKGAINSRMKDYHDLLLLTRSSTLVQFEILEAAITSTFKNRGTAFELINFDEEELKPLQKLWTAHLKNLKKIALKTLNSRKTCKKPFKRLIHTYQR